jgi:hypothetical protein
MDRLNISFTDPDRILSLLISISHQLQEQVYAPPSEVDSDEWDLDELLGEGE